MHSILSFSLGTEPKFMHSILSFSFGTEPKFISFGTEPKFILCHNIALIGTPSPSRLLLFLA